MRGDLLIITKKTDKNLLKHLKKFAGFKYADIGIKQAEIRNASQDE